MAVERANERPAARLRLPAVLLGLLALACSAVAAPPGPLPIPDVQTYERFLLSDWKAGAPTLVVFKDPHCPFCINALKRRRQLSNYNVFLFWSPILGQPSVNRVNELFRCAEPVGDPVINAVLARRRPDCADGRFDQALFDLNNRMTAAYDPRSVPQYWLGGKRVSFSSLTLPAPAASTERVAARSRIRVDWARYRAVAVNEPKADAHNLALVLPARYSIQSNLIDLLRRESRFNWYVVSYQEGLFDNGKFWCERRPNACTGALDRRGSRYAADEFRLLTGLESVEKPVLVLDGKILSDSEALSVVPKAVRLQLY